MTTASAKGAPRPTSMQGIGGAAANGGGATIESGETTSMQRASEACEAGIESNAHVSLSPRPRSIGPGAEAMLRVIEASPRILRADVLAEVGVSATRTEAVVLTNMAARGWIEVEGAGRRMRYTIAPLGRAILAAVKTGRLPVIKPLQLPKGKDRMLAARCAKLGIPLEMWPAYREAVESRNKGATS